MSANTSITSKKTTCPYCGVGCGVAISINSEKEVSVSPDKLHPANLGRLCSKGTALASVTGLGDRLLNAKIKENGIFKNIELEKAMDIAAKKFREIIDKHGPDAVAFYVSGQLLTEDYYAVNKLAKGVIGTANIDTNSRLCMASAVVAHKKAFGADLVPAIYEDLEITELLVFSGHNAAWTHPVLMRRIEQNKKQYRIVIDPRKTETAKNADLHLMIKPQTDVRLWNGLCAYLIKNGIIDKKYIEHHTNGLEDLQKSLKKYDQSIKAIATDCDIDAKDLESFYRKFAASKSAVSLFSQGSNQSAQGVNKGLAVINAHLLTGKIGKKGCAPFSITGQPNAMGGREVGGLANTLACHMDFTPENIDLVSRFWKSDVLPKQNGLKAVDMFNAVEEGTIKAIWIMATNPMVSMPDTNQIARALEKCELVLVSDVVNKNDTLDYADIILPAASWGEKDGTVTNSDRIISRQAAFINNENTKPDWWLIKEIGQRIYKERAHLLDWNSPAEIFDEYARLTEFENNGTRFLNLNGLTNLSESEYDNLKPIRWPVVEKNKGAERLFENGIFQTKDGKAIINAVEPQAAADITSKEYPLALNSSRIRDQWHTMTRTSTSFRLNGHIKEPVISIHPKTAEKYKLIDDRLAEITTKYGSAIAKIQITEDIRTNEIHLPMHFTKSFAPFGRSNQLINPFTDPISGQPEFKHTPAKIRPYEELWHGFILTKKDIALWQTDTFNEDVIWRRTSLENTECYEIAGKENNLNILSYFGEENVISLDDNKNQIFRRAKIIDNKLDGVCFLAPIDYRLSSKDWLIECFAKAEINDIERASILLGKMAGIKDLGALICACNSVYENTIIEAAQNGANTIDKIGNVCTAGTSCGSCKSEIGRILKTIIIPIKAPEYAK